MSLSIPVEDLLHWNDVTAAHWRDFLLANPAAFELPCDIRNSQTVAQVIQHIVAVELRYAQRLTGQPESDYTAVSFDSPEALFATHARAFNLVYALLQDGSYQWSTEIEFQTITMGRLVASRRTILLHLLFHGIRHYAQLATLVRANGFTPDWSMDYLLTAARPA